MAAMSKRKAKPKPSRGFPPIVGPRPTILVLGSLPGQASLAANEYYAQPRNDFWPIMSALCGADPALDYRDRCAALERAGIALWDVLEAAERRGSLDANIVTASARVNDIAGLVAEQRSIRLLAFNGKKAADIFSKRIAADLPRGDIETAVLPSTSPAHAAMRRERKLELWRAALAQWLRRN